MPRSYGQFCGLARALEMVGERWGMLVVRDLLLGPKRFTELREGLPRVAPSILTSRLNELEAAGVVRRRVLHGLDAGMVYELTEYGADLEPIVLTLGLWGARSLGDKTDDELFTMDSAILSLYAVFRPECARDVQVSFEVRYSPEMIVHAVVDDGVLKVGEGRLAGADLVMELVGNAKPIFSGEITPQEALDADIVRIDGDPALLALFADLFHIPASPQRVEGLLVF